MAKYKDYPIYTYDEPATYSDFSGGINTDPSNEHLQPNEMRDCLNMHYKSAALVKRKGASLLCNIECEDELFNVQGVFLFTYRITYIIVAADGKLYKGFYSPNGTIRLNRLPIDVEIPESLDAYNPMNTTIGLTNRVSENINQKHDGFIYSYVIDKNGNKINLEDFFLGDYLDLSQSIIKDQDIVKYNGNYYRLNWTNTNTLPENRYIKRTLITPENTEYWISLDEYNTFYSDEIIQRIDPLSVSYGWIAGVHTGLVLDTKTNTWRKSGYYVGEEWISNGAPGLWKERYEPWISDQAVLYEDNIYICIKTHTNFLNPPADVYAHPNAEWVKLTEKQELLFQNHDSIEAATYNNKMYITTGTRFVVIELISNELVAHTIEPYLCNTTEITNIGYNYLSPYPELCRSTQYNQAITSIGGILAIKGLNGLYTLTPQMNFAQGETEHDYYFKWEKKIGDEWVTIYSYKDNTYKNYTYKYIKEDDGKYVLKDGEYILHKDSIGGPRYNKYPTGYSLSKINLFTIEVEDADKYQYRVSFAKSFEKPTEIADNWDYSKNIYRVGDKVSVQNEAGTLEIYTCIKEHTPKQVLWDNIEYELTDIAPAINREGYYYQTYQIDAGGNYVAKTENPVFSLNTSTRTGLSLYEKQEDGTYKFYCYDTSTIIKGEVYWEKEFTEEAILTEDGVDYDWIVNKVDGEYFGQGASTIAIDLKPEDKFNIIHSCKKIISDGNKFLLYDDKYNSGSWYKTVINNPAYITDRGGLSFKTNKNESLIKVVSFNGNLIAFANAENVGGSIHMITGNGDDWDDQSGYYSPYRRSTINATVSCDNANTVQVCENILVFKYFDTLYYISGSELNNEVVSVYSCNDRIKHNNNFVRIPWDDNSCISEVTEDYYALIWKEKYTIDNEDLILERPALKVKMYYKLGTQQNEKIVYPWLRDESDYFNIDHIVYIKGKPIYLYNNTLTTFNNEVYTDFGNIYKCLIHFRGEDLNYPKMSKLINNVLVYYHRNQYSTIDFDLLIKNEAGHSLIDTASKRRSIQDLRALREGDTIVDNEVRLDSTILDSKVFNTTYKFPLLLADTTIVAENDKEFSVSSITYNYVTSETPDTTPYDLYTNILRPQETRESLGALLKQAALEVKISKPEEIQKAITGFKIIKEKTDKGVKFKTALEITLNNKTEYLPITMFVYDKETKSLKLNSEIRR
jgi:hypothetical protein